MKVSSVVQEIAHNRNVINKTTDVLIQPYVGGLSLYCFVLQCTGILVILSTVYAWNKWRWDPNNTITHFDFTYPPWTLSDVYLSYLH